MVCHMTNILGDKLYHDNIDNTRTLLPSPEELNGKVLVKVWALNFIYMLYGRADVSTPLYNDQT